MKQYGDKILGLLWFFAAVAAGLFFIFWLKENPPVRSARYVAICVGFIALMVMTGQRSYFYIRKERNCR